jgi:hypothetical protein
MVKSSRVPVLRIRSSYKGYAARPGAVCVIMEISKDGEHAMVMSRDFGRAYVALKDLEEVR